MDSTNIPTSQNYPYIGANKLTGIFKYYLISIGTINIQDSNGNILQNNLNYSIYNAPNNDRVSFEWTTQQFNNDPTDIYIVFSNVIFAEITNPYTTITVKTTVYQGPTGGNWIVSPLLLNTLYNTLTITFDKIIQSVDNVVANRVGGDNNNVTNIQIVNGNVTFTYTTPTDTLNNLTFIFTNLRSTDGGISNVYTFISNIVAMQIISPIIFTQNSTYTVEINFNVPIIYNDGTIMIASDGTQGINYSVTGGNLIFTWTPLLTGIITMSFYNVTTDGISFYNGGSIASTSEVLEAITFTNWILEPVSKDWYYTGQTYAIAEFNHQLTGIPTIVTNLTQAVDLPIIDSTYPKNLMFGWNIPPIPNINPATLTFNNLQSIDGALSNNPQIVTVTFVDPPSFVWWSLNQPINPSTVYNGIVVTFDKLISHIDCIVSSLGGNVTIVDYPNGNVQFNYVTPADLTNLTFTFTNIITTEGGRLASIDLQLLNDIVVDRLYLSTEFYITLNNNAITLYNIAGQSVALTTFTTGIPTTPVPETIHFTEYLVDEVYFGFDRTNYLHAGSLYYGTTQLLSLQANGTYTPSLYIPTLAINKLYFGNNYNSVTNTNAGGAHIEASTTGNLIVSNTSNIVSGDNESTVFYTRNPILGWNNVIPRIQGYQYTSLQLITTYPLVNSIVTISDSDSSIPTNIIINNGNLQFDWITPNVSTTTLSFLNLYDGTSYYNSETYTIQLFSNSQFVKWVNIIPHSQSFNYSGIYQLNILISQNVISVDSITSNDNSIISNITINNSNIMFNWITGTASDVNLTFINVKTSQGTSTEIISVILYQPPSQIMWAKQQPTIINTNYTNLSVQFNKQILSVSGITTNKIDTSISNITYVNGNILFNCTTGNDINGLRFIFSYVRGIDGSITTTTTLDGYIYAISIISPSAFTQNIAFNITVQFSENIVYDTKTTITVISNTNSPGTNSIVSTYTVINGLMVFSWTPTNIGNITFTFNNITYDNLNYSVSSQVTSTVLAPIQFVSWILQPVSKGWDYINDTAAIALFNQNIIGDPTISTDLTVSPTNIIVNSNIQTQLIFDWDIPVNPNVNTTVLNFNNLQSNSGEIFSDVFATITFVDPPGNPVWISNQPVLSSTVYNNLIVMFNKVIVSVSSITSSLGNSVTLISINTDGSVTFNYTTPSLLTNMNFAFNNVVAIDGGRAVSITISPNFRNPPIGWFSSSTSATTKNYQHIGLIMTFTNPLVENYLPSPSITASDNSIITNIKVVLGNLQFDWLTFASNTVTLTFNNLWDGQVIVSNETYPVTLYDEGTFQSWEKIPTSQSFPYTSATGNGLAVYFSKEIQHITSITPSTGISNIAIDSTNKKRITFDWITPAQDTIVLLFNGIQAVDGSYDTPPNETTTVLLAAPPIFPWWNINQPIFPSTNFQNITVQFNKIVYTINNITTSLNETIPVNILQNGMIQFNYTTPTDISTLTFTFNDVQAVDGGRTWSITLPLNSVISINTLYLSISNYLQYNNGQIYLYNVEGNSVKITNFTTQTPGNVVINTSFSNYLVTNLYLYPDTTSYLYMNNNNLLFGQNMITTLSPNGVNINVTSIYQLSVLQIYFGTSGVYLTFQNNNPIFINKNNEQTILYQTNPPTTWQNIIPRTCSYPYTGLILNFTQNLINANPILTVTSSNGNNPTNLLITNGQLQMDWTPPTNNTTTLIFKNLYNGISYVFMETLVVPLYMQSVFTNWDTLVPTSKLYYYNGSTQLIADFSLPIQSITSITTSDSSVISNIVIQASPNNNKIQFNWMTGITSPVTITFTGIVTTQLAIEVPPLENYIATLMDPPKYPIWVGTNPQNPLTTYVGLVVRFNKNIASVNNILTNKGDTTVTNINISNGNIIFDCTTGSRAFDLIFNFVEVVASDGGRIVNIYKYAQKDGNDYMGNILWLDSTDILFFIPTNPTNGTRITSWLDKSSTSNNASQNNIMNEPIYITGNSGINSQPSVSFSGTCILNLENSTNIPVNEWTALAVFQTNNINTIQDIFSNLNTTSYEQGPIIINSTNVGMLTTNLFSNRQITTHYTYLISTRVLSGISTVKINGNSVITSTSAFQSMVTIIGNNFSGLIGELLFYNVGLSDSDLSNLELYLCGKWNIDPPINPTWVLQEPMVILTTYNSIAVNFSKSILNVNNVNPNNSDTVVSNITYNNGNVLFNCTVGTLINNLYFIFSNVTAYDYSITPSLILKAGIFPVSIISPLTFTQAYQVSVEINFTEPLVPDNTTIIASDGSTITNISINSNNNLTFTLLPLTVGNITLTYNNIKGQSGFICNGCQSYITVLVAIKFISWIMEPISKGWYYNGITTAKAQFNWALNNISSITSSITSQPSNILIDNVSNNTIDFYWDLINTTDNSAILTFNGLQSISGAVDVPPPESVTINLVNPPILQRFVGQLPIFINTTYTNLSLSFITAGTIVSVDTITTNILSTTVTITGYNNNNVLFDIVTGPTIYNLLLTVNNVLASDGGRLLSTVVVYSNPIIGWNSLNTTPTTKLYQHTGLQIIFTRSLVAGYSQSPQISGSGTITNISVVSGLLQFDWLTPDLDTTSLTFNNLWDGNLLANGEVQNINLYDSPVFQSWISKPQSKNFNYIGIYTLIAIFSQPLQSISSITASDNTTISNISINTVPNNNEILFNWNTSVTPTVILTFNGMITTNNAYENTPPQFTTVTLTDSPASPAFYNTIPILASHSYSGLIVTFSKSISSCSNVTSNVTGNIINNITIVNGNVMFDCSTGPDLTGLQFTFTNVISTDGGQINFLYLPVIFHNSPTNWLNISTTPTTKLYNHIGIILQFTHPLLTGYNPTPQIIGPGTISGITISNGMLQFNWVTPNTSPVILTFNNLWDGNSLVSGEIISVTLYPSPTFVSWIGITPQSQSYAYVGSNNLTISFSQPIQSIGSITSSDSSIINNITILPTQTNIQFELTTTTISSITLTILGLVTIYNSYENTPYITVPLTLVVPPTNPIWVTGIQPNVINSSYTNLSVQFSTPISSVQSITTNAVNTTIFNISISSGNIVFNCHTGSDITNISFTFIQICGN